MLQQFTILVDEIPTDEQMESIFGGFDDLGVGSSPWRGVGVVSVDREAASLAEAIGSAVRDVESAGLRPIRIDIDKTVSLVEIADRIGRPVAAVRSWATGVEGPGGFPAPTRTGPPTDFYRWNEVSRWLRRHLGVDLPEVEPVVEAANLVLLLRGMATEIDGMEVFRDLIIP